MMDYKSTFKSKNGLDIIVRNATVEDAVALISLKLGYLRNTKSIPLFLDEYKKDTKEESQLIDKLCNEKNSCLLLAEYEGQLIGNLDINGNQRRKLIHTAVLGMGISYEWQGKGVGNILISKAIEWANQNELLDILMLEVYDSNEAGKCLYNKVGFQEYGRINNYFKENDNLIDNIKMVKYLDNNTK